MSPDVITIDEATFQYGNYTVTVRLKYRHAVPHGGPDASYIVRFTATHTDHDANFTATGSTPVTQEVDRGLLRGTRTVKADIPSLIKNRWQQFRNRLDTIDQRTSGELSITFQSATDASGGGSSHTQPETQNIEQELTDLGEGVTEPSH
jgi:hypothetical protein